MTGGRLLFLILAVLLASVAWWLVSPETYVLRLWFRYGDR